MDIAAALRVQAEVVARKRANEIARSKLDVESQQIAEEEGKASAVLEKMCPLNMDDETALLGEAEALTADRNRDMRRMILATFRNLIQSAAFKTNPVGFVDSKTPRGPQTDI